MSALRAAGEATMDPELGHLLVFLLRAAAINMRSFGDTDAAPTIKGWMAGAGLAVVERLDSKPQPWLIIGRRA